jgi:Uma2 family endonuclease
MSAVATNYLELIDLMPDGSRLYREGVSWEEYEELLDELMGVRSVRVSYDQGRMEIMSLSSEHEGYAGLFTHLIQILTEELGLEFTSRGSTTLKSQGAEKGAEPDDCFYIGELDRIRGKKRLNLDLDAPPDLAIEVDITNPTLDKLSIYAGLGVPELWRYDEGKVEFYHLEDDYYAAIRKSDLFPFLTPAVVAEAIERGDNEDINAMRREFRNWVQKNKPQ